jgi:hypothetical protein
VTSGACDRGSGSYASLGPPPRLAHHSFETYEHCADAPPSLECYQGVTLRPLIVLRFDRVMAPTSFGRTNVKITSGKVADVGFKTVRVDPVERMIVIALDGPLLPSTTYNLVIASVDAIPNRLAAFDGAMFEGTKTIQLRTGAVTDKTKDYGSVDPLPAADPCKAIEVLKGSESRAASCLGARCHGGGPEPVPPAMGLNLSTEEMIFRTAVDQPASLVQLAANPTPLALPAAASPTGWPSSSGAPPRRAS